ncbi:M4 family metallopeptidase [Pseudomonas japonica]|uniref:M4 family metallopeptidase n=1 Tax=Pseudomonas japonica TaxID=256466 RepID=UPI0015E44D63|nr:M4 family metallopeptidase [Pseudomonas japonica]MBA1245920.1 peptidase M4 family protein [Pseudomonas japonica]
MCHRCLFRNPIFCMVPPYILNAIAKNGDSNQRASAMRTKALDSTLRSMRLNQLGRPVRRPIQPLQDPIKRRTIYNANNSQSLPGMIVRLEGENSTGDPAVDEAYDGLGATYDFFSEIFDRNSIDDSGMQQDATVHFGVDYNNAFWNSAQMVFGDGDGKIFNRFTMSIDVIGHELSHGVTEDEAELFYLKQSGALNESVSDVFGSLIKQYVGHQTAAEADWLIGNGLFAEGIDGIALRSMRNPGSAFDDRLIGKDPQPKHMDNFVNTFEDNGGVHINSGIPNHAFYLISTSIGGYAWEKAGRIWYDTLRDPRLKPDSTIARFARISSDIASRSYGIGSAEHQAVSEGWAMVGVRT